MTPEQLKTHRRAICEALIEGKQCQVMTSKNQWIDLHQCLIAAAVFNDCRNPEHVRIKPEPRKCWVAWSKKGSFWCATTEAKKREVENDYPNITINWQLVEESLT